MKKKGWRKTEYLFKLGRFIPPFMIVGKYYKDEDEDERRRIEIQKEYDKLVKRLRVWDSKSLSTTTPTTTNKKNDDDDDEERKKKKKEEQQKQQQGEGSNTIISISSSSFPRTEYYLQRMYVQMVKNMNMMSYIMTDVVCKRDFPYKVKTGGERIIENMGPTVERTGKLMRDVWDMWMGWTTGGGNGNGGGSWGGGGGGRF